MASTRATASRGTCGCIPRKRKPLETEQKPVRGTGGAASKTKGDLQNSEHAKAAREQRREPFSPPRGDLTTPSAPRLPKGELALRALEEKMVKDDVHHGLA